MFGVFKITYRSADKAEGFKRRKLLWIYDNFIHPANPVFLFLRRSQSEVKTERWQAAEDARILQRNEAYEDRYSRCHTYKTKYYVHECDSLGNFTPTKKELRDAEALFEEIEEKQLKKSAG